jgi:predicted metal-dependent hydrolase
MSSELKVRWPNLKFSREDMIWEDNPEASIIWIGGSSFPIVIEPWLNRVMVKSRKFVSEDRPDLKQDIDDFVRQESNHYRMHEEFNVYAREAGFVVPDELQDEGHADYRHLLQNKSINWLTAYCAGFENFTLFQARWLFETAPDFCREGNGISEVMMWHLAEEYEHRKVCHDIYANICGNYFLRIWGLVFSFFHMNGHIQKRVKLFLDKYREGMTPAERKASIKRERAFNRRFMLWFLPRALKIMIPFYDPGKAKAHPRLQHALKKYDALAAETEALKAGAVPA